MNVGVDKKVFLRQIYGGGDLGPPLSDSTYALLQFLIIYRCIERACLICEL